MSDEELDAFVTGLEVRKFTKGNKIYIYIPKTETPNNQIEAQNEQHYDA